MPLFVSDQAIQLHPSAFLLLLPTKSAKESTLSAGWACLMSEQGGPSGSLAHFVPRCWSSRLLHCRHLPFDHRPLVPVAPMLESQEDFAVTSQQPRQIPCWNHSSLPRRRRRHHIVAPLQGRQWHHLCCMPPSPRYRPCEAYPSVRIRSADRLRTLPARMDQCACSELMLQLKGTCGGSMQHLHTRRRSVVRRRRSAVPLVCIWADALMSSFPFIVYRISEWLSE